MNETPLNLTNLTMPNVNLTGGPSADTMHDSIFGTVWNMAVGFVQYILNTIGIPATAEHAAWVVLGIMVFALWRNMNRLMRMAEDLFKVALGIIIVLFVLQLGMGVKII